MTSSTTSTLAILTALGGLFLAGSAFAQSAEAPAAASETPAQTRARAATSSLNGGPAQSTLTPRPNAAPPLAPEERPRPVTPVRPSAVAPTPAAPTVRTPAATPQVRTPTLTAPAARAGTSAAGRIQTPAARTPTTRTPAGRAPQTASPIGPTVDAPTTPEGPSLTLAPGQTAPTPISMPLGYYVRGDKACNQVWPGEGDLAWFTPTSFTIDFGGCEPGQFLQTGLNSWSEEQQCQTETGGDAGIYSVTYEVIGTGTVLRRAHLAIDDRIEQDLWAHCETEDVPVEARFKS